MNLKSYSNQINLNEINKLITMNPIDEFDYYTNIVEKYEKLAQNSDNFCVSTFVSKEIIKVMKQYKNTCQSNSEFENFMGEIVKNSIILLLSFFNEDKNDNHKSYSELNRNEKKDVKNKLLPLLYS